MTESQPSAKNTFVYSSLCLLLGYLSGSILVILTLSLSAVLLALIIRLAGLTIGFSQSVTAYRIAEVIYPLVLFLMAPLVNFAWILSLSRLSRQSKTPAGWSLALGAALSFVSISKHQMLWSGSDTVQMTWAPAVATGVIGLGFGAYIVSRSKGKQAAHPNA